MRLTLVLCKQRLRRKYIKNYNIPIKFNNFWQVGSNIWRSRLAFIIIIYL